jgi:hypothetical protein
MRRNHKHRNGDIQKLVLKLRAINYAAKAMVPTQCDLQLIGDDSIPVHKTLRDVQWIAIENTARQCAALPVHQNEFLWTTNALRGREVRG